jgi:hypothetical protein
VRTSRPPPVLPASSTHVASACHLYRQPSRRGAEKASPHDGDHRAPADGMATWRSRGSRATEPRAPGPNRPLPRSVAGRRRSGAGPLVEPEILPAARLP